MLSHEQRTNTREGLRYEYLRLVELANVYRNGRNAINHDYGNCDTEGCIKCGVIDDMRETIRAMDSTLTAFEAVIEHFDWQEQQKSQEH